MGWIRIATVYKLPAQWINMSQEKTNCVFCFHFPELSFRLFITSSFRAVDTAPVTHSAPLSFQPIVSTSHDSDGWDTSSQEQKDGCYAALSGFFCHKPYPLWRQTKQQTNHVRTSLFVCYLSKISYCSVCRSTSEMVRLYKCWGKEHTASWNSPGNHDNLGIASNTAEAWNFYLLTTSHIQTSLFDKKVLK
jgi:hypothetical protein